MHKQRISSVGVLTNYKLDRNISKIVLLKPLRKRSQKKVENGTLTWHKKYN